MTAEFLRLLFDPEDYTCLAATAKGTKVFPIFDTDLTAPPQFFSINALDGAQDRAPQEDWHSADRPRRANHNVVKFRNILVEFDKLTLEEQRARAEDIGLPFTTCVFSGSKSFHFIISLETPLPGGAAEYTALVNRVYQVLPQADKACRNPSRLSRFPGFLRDGQVEQELIETRSRITYAELDAWLTKHGAPPQPALHFEPVGDDLRDAEELFFQHGQRWEELRRFAGRFRAWGFSEAAIHDCLMALYEHHCEHLPQDTSIVQDMERLAAWTARRPPGNTKPRVVAQTSAPQGRSRRVVMPDGKVYKVPLGALDQYINLGGRLIK